jgi:hypothetical protein
MLFDGLVAGQVIELNLLILSAFEFGLKPAVQRTKSEALSAQGDNLLIP